VVKLVVERPGLEKMSMIVRRADLESDRKEMIRMILQYLTPSSDDLRFDWLYRNNPWGEALAWVATDGDSGTLVGMVAAFPRRVYVGDREEWSWVLGDFCISDSYRSLGPALQLQRGCLAEVDSAGIAFWYDFPSMQMMAIYKRLGISRFGRMIRLAKPLRVDRKIEKVVKSPALARGLSAAGNMALRIYEGKFRNKEELTVSSHRGSCGQEFSALSEQVGGRYGACLQRSAEYLNWRYLASPACKYELLTARHHGTLVAYLVYTCQGDDATLVDLFGAEDPEILSSLVKGLTAVLQERGVMTVHAPVFESHPWIVLLQRFGFRVREESPVVLSVSPGHPSRQNVSESKRWFLMQGDRDS
jgi:hypothetical protein